MGRLTSNKPFSFGADPDYDPDPGILNGIFTTVGSAALGEVCTPRVLLKCIELIDSNLGK